MAGKTSGAAIEGVVGRGKSRGQFKKWRKWPERGDWGLLGMQSEGRAISGTGVSLFS